ncbi:FMN-binding protein [Streptomyces sp. S.PNR 29]|uniref:FMN-binding protein n=1 Tax=Streptomyces sp. S.PNR 29 TaxID=2973805 RepID=UPI0025B034C9|nr:FMN-binding protein [Streptomyces sp. S.PNR 29]MDN0198329.1 FMN-binding protein [Streptomyces sp. S.PNR 29]
MRKKHPFRRALLAAVGTVSGIVLLIALKPTTDPALAKADEPTAGITAQATGSPSPSASSHSPSATASPSKRSAKKRAPATSPSASPSHSASAAPARSSSTPSAPKTASAATSAAPTTRTVTGATAETKYGPVQVRITLTGSRITGATAVRSPDETPRSKEISSTAVPRLNQETLQAQSADIDTVSGATYTSAGYRQSLQSALDRAGL